MSIKSACLAIAIFYIIAIVSNDDDGSVVAQQDTFNRNSNLRRLSLIDPKTVETRHAIDTTANDDGDQPFSGNETLWFLGNSVSRIHAFAAAALFSKGNDYVGREDQKILCGAGGSPFKKARPGQGNVLALAVVWCPIHNQKLGFSGNNVYLTSN